MISSGKSPHSEIWLYVASGALAIVCACTLGNLWQADLSYPISLLSGDAISTQACVFKGMIENHWFLDNPSLAAPFGANFRDFAGPDVLTLAAIKALSVFTDNHILLRNIVALASYPLVTLSSLFVMRRLGIRFGLALASSLLFAFVSFHQARIGCHAFLAIGYFTVPFATLVSLWFLEDKPLFVVASPGYLRWRPQFNRVTAAACVWCATIGLTGSVYYAVFSCYVFAVAGALAALQRRSLLPLLRVLSAVAVLVFSVAVGLLPMLFQHWKHGATTMLERIPQDAETYGLKIVQLLIPGVGHRVPALDRLSAFYNRVAPLVTENRDSYLGIVGGFGFLYLVFCLLRIDAVESRTRNLSRLNIAVVLLATIGGFSSVISFLFSSTIRSYNRASLFIAFFSLLALALLAERVAAKWLTSRARRVAFDVTIAAIATLGLLDQYAPPPDYQALKRDYIMRGRFIEQVEHSVPPGSNIFQYPLFPFPESPPIYQLKEYAEFLPYLHSKSLRWSYGAVKGRRAAAWQANIAAMPPDRAADALAQAGFRGILIARDGYRDHGNALEELFRLTLGQPVATSADASLAFYSLAPRIAQLKKDQGEAEYERRKQEALNPMFLGWLSGCYPKEVSGIVQSVWCGAQGHFVVENPSATPIHVVLAAKLKLPSAYPTKVSIRSKLVEHDIVMTTTSYDLWEGFDVPPGEHMFTITTTSEKPLTEAGRDRRLLLESPHFNVVVRSGSFQKR